jgi:hypothetical protein
MDTRGIAKEYRLSSWAQIAHERSESGLSVRDFCWNRGIPENTYYYWQRRFREMSAHALVSRAERMGGSSGADSGINDPGRG